MFTYTNIFITTGFVLRNERILKHLGDSTAKIAFISEEITFFIALILTNISEQLSNHCQKPFTQWVPAGKYYLVVE